MKAWVLLILLGFGTCFGQVPEKVMSTPHYEMCWGGARVGNRLFFERSASSSFYSGTLEEGYLFKCNEQLDVLDSVKLSTYFQRARGINKIKAISDSTFIGIIRWKGGNSVAIFDTNLNLQYSHLLSFKGDTVIKTLLDVAMDGSNIIVGGSVMPDTLNSPLIELALLMVFNKVTGDRVVIHVFDALGYRSVSVISVVNGRTVFGVDNSGNSLFTLDASYNLDSSYNLSPYHNEFFYSTPHFVEEAGNGNVRAMIHESFTDNFSMYTFDSSFVPKSRDTVHVDANYVAVHNDNFAKAGANSYYMTATLDLITFEPYLQPGLFRKLMVWNLDSLGNVRWSKEILDSSYRYVSQIIPATDGGVFLFSILYDPATYATNNTDLSIIKLDANGNIQNLGAEEDFLLKSQSLSLCPNPANEKVWISGIEENLDIEYTIYGISGHRLHQGMLAEDRKLDVSFMQPGPYLIQLKGERGKAVIRKLIVR